MVAASTTAASSVIVVLGGGLAEFGFELDGNGNPRLHVVVVVLIVAAESSCKQLSTMAMA